MRQEITELRRAAETLGQTYRETQRQLNERQAELAKVTEDLRKEVLAREEAEHAVRESEEQRRILIEDIMMDGTIVHDRGIILEVNKVIEDMLGYGKEEMIGSVLYGFFSSEYREIVKTHALQKCEDLYEAELVRKDGRAVPVELRGGSFPRQGQEIRAVVVRDLTERRENERRLQQAQDELERKVEQRTEELADANERLWIEILKCEKANEALRERDKAYQKFFSGISEPVVMADLEGDPPGRIIFVNRAAEEVLGYAGGEIVGMNLPDLEVPRSSKPFAQRIENLMRKHWVRREAILRRKDGSVFPAEVNTGLLEVGGAKYALCFGSDITERKQAEEHLKAAVKEKEVMLREIHHRVKNNLSLIISLLDLESQYASVKSVEEVFEDVEIPHPLHGLLP